MYRVIFKFADLLDNNHVYEIGEPYPRDGYEPTEERIKELASKANKVGKPLIESVFEEVKEEPAEEEPKPKKRKKADAE